MSDHAGHKPTAQSTIGKCEDHLSEHQMTEHDRHYSNVIQELLRFGAIFNVEFELHFGRLEIRIDRLCGDCLGHYQGEYNAFGLKNEIDFDEQYILNGLANEAAWTGVLGTLLHEMIYFWDHLLGGGSTGRRIFHTKRSRDKSAECGLLVDERGVSLGVVPKGRFEKLLIDHELSVPSFDF